MDSAANVLKIAEGSDQAETCRMLTVIDDFLRNYDPSARLAELTPFSSRSDIVLLV